MLGKDMQMEKDYARQVQEFLEKEIVRLGELIIEYKNNVKEQGEDFNRDNPNGGMYSGMELTELHYEMEQQIVRAEEAAHDIYFYKRLKNSPYFARIDFKYDGDAEPRKIYIGLRSLQDEETFEIYVCDWRAPVSSLFYEDFEDKAFYDAPMGRITGDISLKRQFKFEKGELTYYVDSDLKIDDDILRDVLSSSSGEHLKVIVNSIQREQNKVVRYSDKDNVLVLGPAGSGKTSVGFHRLAFLLYRNRTELTSAEVIMFSNNDIFSSYVADIIPELGEMPINYSSFYRIFDAEIPAVQVEDYYSLAEAIMNGDELRKESAQIKINGDFINYIEAAANCIEPEFSDICFYDEVIISAQKLLERFLSDDGSSHKSRGERLSSYVQSVIDEYFIMNKKEIYRQIDMDSEIDDDTSKLVKLKRRDIKNAAVEMIKRAVLTDPVSVYFKILGDYARENNLPHLTDSMQSLKRGVVAFEDALGIVYTKCVTGAAAVLTGVKHILIDEAQDLSLIQHKIILSMFPRARFTLLADTNQAILPQLNTTSGESLSELYKAVTLCLDKSYRSTKEINSFAVSLLPEEKRYNMFEREGEPVVCEEGNLEQFLEFCSEKALKDKGVCFITPTQRDATELYKSLKDKISGLRICSNMSCELSRNPIIMPVALTKGLEFDSVVVCDMGGFSGEENKPLLYMASTRALHKLSIFKSK